MKNLMIRSEKGFTLVEIMIVLVIIVFMMALLGNRLIGADDKAKRKMTEMSMQTLKQYIGQYRMQYNTLPSSLQDLIQCNEKTGPGCVPICNEEDLRDSWGNDYAYSTANSGRTYKLMSYGADLRAGGDGVNYDVFIEGP